MSITYTAPPAESPLPVTTVPVAVADDPYTAPTIQVWRSERQAALPSATSPRAAAEVLPGSPPCEPPPARVTPFTAPTLQGWRTTTPAPASPAPPLAPCQRPTPGDPLPTVVDGLGARPLRLDAANRQRFAPDIQRVAATYQLEPALLHAVISAESAYNPQARSPKGARGLMQLMPDTARRFGVADPDEPTANLHGGARYLRWLLDLFTDIRLALAAYNAGEGAVQRYGNTIPPDPETRTYVRRVLDFYRYYRSKTGL